MKFFKWFKKSKNIKPPFREKTEIIINVSDAGDWSVGMPSTDAKFKITCDQKIDDEDLENLTEE